MPPLHVAPATETPCCAGCGQKGTERHPRAHVASVLCVFVSGVRHTVLCWPHAVVFDTQGSAANRFCIWPFICVCVCVCSPLSVVYSVNE